MAVLMATLAAMICAAGGYSMWRAWRRPRRPDAGCSSLVLGMLGGASLMLVGLSLLLYLLL